MKYKQFSEEKVTDYNKLLVQTFLLKQILRFWI